MKHSDPLVQKIKQALDQQPLDDDTTRRLKQARQLALQPAQSWWRMPYLLPATAMASLIAISLMLTLKINAPGTDMPAESIEVFELLSNAEELELYENLEFYVWLDQQPQS